MPSRGFDHFIHKSTKDELKKASILRRDALNQVLNAMLPQNPMYTHTISIKGVLLAKPIEHFNGKLVERDLTREFSKDYLEALVNIKKVILYLDNLISEVYDGEG